MRFPPRVIIVCSRKEVGFDYKNNHRYDKLPNFQLDIISIINCKMLVI